MIDLDKALCLLQADPTEQAILRRLLILRKLSTALEAGLISGPYRRCLGCGLSWQPWQEEPCPVCAFVVDWVKGWRAYHDRGLTHVGRWCQDAQSPALSLGLQCAEYDREHGGDKEPASVLAAWVALRSWEEKT
ncbi:MAG: hypothetical protein CMJ75_22860 [Planctomycetaceae bacterium]|nr:hypothetical protein [Planctomycetaceae bacterium]